MAELLTVSRLATNEWKYYNHIHHAYGPDGHVASSMGVCVDSHFANRKWKLWHQADVKLHVQPWQYWSTPI